MNRGDFVLSSAIIAIASLVGCGGGGGNPDAVLVHDPDAGPPDARPQPDAFVCTMDVCPGDVCTDFDTDPQHCGDCDTVCQAAATCSPTGCACPTYDFLPDTVENGLLEQVLDNLPGAYVAFSAFAAAELDALGVGYPIGVALDEPIVLDGANLPNPPFVIAAYDIDINTMMPRAAFAAISGTLVLHQACSTGARGTVTDATFQGATIFPSPMLDPDGCTFHVDTVDFVIGDFTGTDCTPPA